MQPQSNDQETRPSLQHLPEDAEIVEIMYSLYVLNKPHKSLEAIEQGEITSHEVLTREIEPW